MRLKDFKPKEYTLFNLLYNFQKFSNLKHRVNDVKQQKIRNKNFRVSPIQYDIDNSHQQVKKHFNKTGRHILRRKSRSRFLGNL